MATKEQLMSALRNADKAGDIAAAKQLANALSSGRYEQQTQPEQQPQQQPEQGFLDNVGNALSKRGEKFASDMQGVGNDLLTVNPLQTLAAGQQGITRIGGALAGAGADIIGEGISSIADTITPEFIQEGAKDALKYVADSPVGSAAKSVAEIYAGFRNKNPELAQTIADTANMAGFVTGGSLLKKPAQQAGKEIVSLMPATTANKQIAQKLLSGTDEALSRELAPYKIKPQTKTEQLLGMDAKSVKDPLAKDAIKQGFDPAVIQSIKTGSKADKAAQNKMVGIMEKIRDNAEYGLKSRPTDVVGDSLLKRFKVVKDTNKRAGENIKKVVNSIGNRPFNAQKIESSFKSGLDDIGIKLGRDADGVITVDFAESSIRGIPGLEKTVTDVVEQMASSPFPKVKQAHNLKKYLDEKINYDKLNSGLSGKTESLLKDLRRSINDEIGTANPRYKTVNRIYADTIDPLNELQNLAGKGVDLLGERGNSALGQKLRGIMSNNVSRNRLIKSMTDIEGLAKKYGGKFTDSIEKQILFADELDKVFKPAGRTSFQGQIEQVADRALGGMVSPKTEALNAVGGAVKKMRKIDEKGAFRAIKKLLREGK